MELGRKIGYGLAEYLESFDESDRRSLLSEANIRLARQHADGLQRAQLSVYGGYGNAALGNNRGHQLSRRHIERRLNVRTPFGALCLPRTGKFQPERSS